MIVPAQAVRVVIATRPIDFRRGHDSLAAYVQNELKLDPHSGALIVFRSRRGDRIKVLVWDGSGLVLVYKRLEEGTFKRPRVEAAQKSVELRASELAMILDGIDLASVKRTNRYRRAEGAAG